MNKKRFDQIMAGQTTVAKKVYEGVPISEPWPVSMITGEVFRLNGRRSIGEIEGTLNSLKHSGLIKEPKRGVFIRVPVRETEQAADEQDYFVKPEQKKENTLTVQKVAKSESAAEKLAALSDRVAKLSADMKSIVADLDAAAMAVLSESEENDKKLAQFNQLKSLLKGI